MAEESRKPIKLGEKVKDSITGFSGVTIARTDWLYGCVRFGVQTSELHEGKPIDPVWFDEAQLVSIESGQSGSADTPAGPKSDPARSNDPRR